ncbi:MAG: RNase adapter RapZ [Fusobacterium sp.]|uniref:RNase adapter RapZ n=1 Tax=Fusobacterium sp. SB021 TaxID=2744227 RepID=UPI001DE08CD1|nr:RNase adapter RapZ [Fusobacterium sp.]
MKLVIVTGLSGAGKTTALKALEDSGYFTMDNVLCQIAIFLLQNLEKGNSELNIEKLALGIDNRAISSPKEFMLLLNCLESLKVDYQMVFLDSSDEVILNRYNLTRRRHPFAAPTLLESIKREREAMNMVLERSTVVIDTSEYTSKMLSNKIKELATSERKEDINIHVQSFGFKYGVPMDLDLMFDVRVLPNPYYIEDLKLKTGNDKEVYEYVMSFPESEELYEKFIELIKYMIPLYKKDGKQHLSIGIGCSGGQHRSVAFVNRIAKELSYLETVDVYISHREGERHHWT